MRFKNINIEGSDCSGKTTLFNQLHRETNFKYNIQDRSCMSMYVYSKLYERDDSSFWFDKILDDIKRLEVEIDKMQNYLPKLESFVLPSGNEISSACHIARTICRRAERNLVTLLDESSETNPLYVKYLNRLSDYLFVLARETLIANGGSEMIWQKD